jgi:signal transduction histidine kinase
VLLVLVVALGVPLAVNLERRVTAEHENNALVLAQAIAGIIGPDTIEEASGAMAPGASRDAERALRELRRIAEDATTGVRVVVVDRQGVLLVDTDGTYTVGTPFASADRPEVQSALAGVPTSEIRHSDTLGRDLMATAVPVYDETGRIVGAVRVTQDVQALRDSVVRTRLGLLAIGIAGLVAGLLLAFALAASLSRPLARLAETARRLGRGELTARAEDVRGAAEIEDLARSFDEMADRVERTVRAQREFVANASHQLRTPLTGMKLRLEAAVDASEGDLRTQLEAAEREVDRLAAVVDRLLIVSREVEEGRHADVDLALAVGRALERWTERAEAAGSTLHAEPRPAVADAIETDVDQILDNLLENAISYAPGDVELEAGGEDGVAFVAVRDHGPGIAQDELERVTERFYRGREATARSGSGLGLSIARSLAERSGGALEVSTAEGGGTRVEVRFPRAAHGAPLTRA